MAAATRAILPGKIEGEQQVRQHLWLHSQLLGTFLSTPRIGAFDFINCGQGKKPPYEPHPI